MNGLCNIQQATSAGTIQSQNWKRKKKKKKPTYQENQRKPLSTQDRLQLIPT